MNQDHTDTVARVKLWEVHGQTIMLGLIMAVLTFTAKTLWDSNAIQAAMTEKISSLSNQVAKLEGAVSAMQSQYVTRPEFATHEQRIQALEGRRR